MLRALDIDISAGVRIASLQIVLILTLNTWQTLMRLVIDTTTAVLTCGAPGALLWIIDSFLCFPRF